MKKLIGKWLCYWGWHKWKSDWDTMRVCIRCNKEQSKQLKEVGIIWEDD